jgi:two-component system NtrC family response regulator
MSRLNILVVEDEKLARTVMAKNLAGHVVEFAGDLAAAKRCLDDGHFDLCFIDLHLGDDKEASGLELIPMAVEKGIYSVVMSGCGKEEMVGKAQELGCKDFYTKGNEQSNIAAVITKYRRSKAGFDVKGIFASRFITEDPATRASVTEAIKYAGANLPIMILGPSGTGKTCLAKIIHEHSGRGGEFVDINCSVYTEELLEAELFGCKAGAFTDAKEDRKGRLAQAHKGTLFLDEIGAMSLTMQTNLLKAIEERSFYPIGSDKPEFSDFRVISATLDDPQQLLTRGRMRFDFFQRIHGLSVKLAPLSARRCDIMPMVQFFMRMKRDRLLSFSPEAKARLLGHAWPGNAHELKMVVDLMVSGSESRVTPEEVDRHLHRTLVAPPTDPFVGERHYRYAVDGGLDNLLDCFTVEIIRRNLAENKGIKARTMKALKISERRLYAALKKEASDGLTA